MTHIHSAAEFVRACLRVGRCPDHLESLRSSIRNAEMDWGEVAGIASAHYVLPALYPELNGAGLLEELPPDFASYLEASHELNRIRNEEILAETAAIARILNGVGIEPIVLKGVAYLLAGVYQDPASRMMADIDMLVPSSRLMGAVAALRASGFESATPDNGQPPSFGHHYRPLWRGNKTMTVELHERVLSRSGEPILSPEEVIEESIPIPIEDARLRVPSREHLLLHYLIHSQTHYGVRVWMAPPLRSVYDFVQLCAENNINWPRVLARLRRHRQAHIIALTWLTAEKILALQPSPEVMAPMRGARITLFRSSPRLKYLLYFGSALLLPSLHWSMIQMSSFSGWCRMIRKLGDLKAWAKLVFKTRSIEGEPNGTKRNERRITGVREQCHTHTAS